MRAWKLVILEAMVLAGCGGDNPQDPDAAPPIDAPPDAAQLTKDVNGVAVQHNVTDTAVVDQPRDLSAVTFTSFSPTATGFSQRTGAGSADGTFVVPVDFGATEWQLAAKFGTSPLILVGSSLTPDLGVFSLGRGDKTLPTLSTPVALNVTGLAPWQSLDGLQVMASNAGSIVYDLQFSLAAEPTVGATTIASDFDWFGQFAPLVDAAKGDTVKVYQMISKPSGLESYQALGRIGSPAAFTQTDGVASTLNVALAAVPQDKTFEAHFKRSQFDAMRAGSGPNATASTSQVIAIDALPGAATRGFFDVAPDLVLSLPALEATDLNQTFTYGNPFSTGGTPWDEFMIVVYTFSVPVLATGATTARNISAGAYMYMPLASIAGGNITPKVTPIRNVKVAGMDLSAPRTGVGLTPTLTWDAPATGTVTNYNVRISRVSANGGATSVTGVATFNTKSRSLQIPTTILVPDGSYIARIIAEVAPGYDPTVSPLLGGLDYASAAHVTAQFKP